MTLREELNGEKKGVGREDGGKAADVKSLLRMQHLQNLALWAGGEASMPSYAAFLGNRLATCGEATGVPLDPSLFPCQRCESILQPGFNCTVRVEKNRAKVRKRRNTSYVPTKNIVIYTCHFCSHRNVKRGTPKRHMKEIFASKLKPVSELESTASHQKSVSCESVKKGRKEIDKKLVKGSLSQPMPVLNPNSCMMHPELREEVTVESSPTTPKLVLLEGKRKRKRKKSDSLLKDQVGNESISMTPAAEKVAGESSKKRRKGWSSLKEIAENSGSAKSRDIKNLTLPFFI